MSSRHPLPLAALLGAVALVAAPSAAAHGGPPSETPADVSELPPTPLKREILDIQKRAKKQGHPPELVKGPLEEAIRAGQRAVGARDAADMRHGGMLTALGRAWVRTAEMVLRAATAEEQASKEAKRLREITTKVKRAEALLAEQQARLGRLRARVKELEAARREATDDALSKERERVEKSSPAPSKASKEPKGGAKP